jgi:AraC-like DNA-binding protein
LKIIYPDNIHKYYLILPESAGSMFIRYFQPSGFLKNYIKHYCFMEISACEGDVMERVIPTRHMQLMFHYRQPFAGVQSDKSLIVQPRTVVSGLSSTFSDVTTQGEAGVVFVTFYPAGACHFFKFPLHDLEDKSIDMADVAGNSIRETEEKLFEKHTPEERIEVIEAFLRDRFNPVPQYDYDLIRAGVGLIHDQGGKISSLQLAGKLCVTPRSLERKFAEYVGKSPKQFIRLIRFEKIITDFSQYKNINLTGYAYQNGYFDQSHFIRDFKMLSGLTPREYLFRYSHETIPNS